jgi:uncharacterized membrane protein YfcA
MQRFLVSVWCLLLEMERELLRPTLNVGHTLSTIVQAFIYIAIVDVDMSTLMLLIVASILGAWLGAGVVAGWPRRNVRIGMGIALLLAAVMTLLQVLQVTTGAGESLQLTDTRLALDSSEILPSAL